MPVHALVTVQCGQQGQSGRRALGLGERDRPVEGDHRVGRDPFQDQVKSVHLRPVGLLGRGRVGVRGGDGGLEQVRPQRRAGQRRLDQLDPLVDQSAVPLRTVLLVQRHQVAGRRRTCLPAGVGQQHQREQPGHLAVLGQLRVHHPGQPDRRRLISVTNLTGAYNVSTGHRDTYGVQIRTEGDHGGRAGGSRIVDVELDGHVPTKDVQVQLPALATAGVESVAGGSFDPAAHAVTLAPGSREARIILGPAGRPDVSVTAHSTAPGQHTLPLLTAGIPATVSASVTGTGQAPVSSVQLCGHRSWDVSAPEHDPPTR